MISTTTIYEGSELCGCGRLLTPLEVLFSPNGICTACRALMLQDLINQRLAAPDEY